MSRVVVLIDGFNLYHALDYNKVKANPAINPHRYKKYKWLDLYKLGKGYVYDKNDSLVDVYYFTTLAYWNLSKVRKHKNYIAAQEANGVKIIYGEFKEKTKYCNICRGNFRTYEEKQTDVNIALFLLKLAVEDVYDKVIIISGDTDLVPAVKLVQSMFSKKQVGVVIPIGKISEDFKKTANFNYKMKENHLKSCLLPNPVTTSNKMILHCPPEWL